MHKSEAGYTLIELLVVVMIPVIICLKVLVIWVVCSGITSAIKAGTDNCGQRYVVEKVLSGDWFCPDE